VKKLLIPLFVVLVTTLGTGVGYGYYLHTQQEEPVIEEVLAEEPEEIIEEVHIPVNFLTGLPLDNEEAEGKRPVAVMVSNVWASMPQNGVGSADIIFEIPVEGGATRLMALFGDMSAMPIVTPVRSARLYFPVFAQGFDAFYAYWGSHPSIMGQLDSMLGESRFDGAINTGGLYGRDEGRLAAGVPLEHTGIFDGTRFKEEASEMGIRLDRNEDSPETAFLFHPDDKLEKPKGEEAKTIHINFSGTTADFTFDEKTRTYLKDFNGVPHMDGATDEQLAFTNVFALETNIWVNEVGHNEFEFSGEGFYFSDGAVQRIRWEKRDRLQFFDEAGHEIQINRGKTYIGITHLGGVAFAPGNQEGEY